MLLHPQLNKIIKEGARPAGNLIKYDIPALKRVLTTQKYDEMLSVGIVAVLVHDPSAQAASVYSPSIS